MPRVTPEAGAPCWIDLSTTNIDTAVAFYGGLFGWTFDDTGAEFGHYHLAFKDGEPVAGIMAKQDTAMPDAWTTYLAVDDAEAAGAAITAAGGQVVVPAMAVGPRGSMLCAVDPAGAFVGAWQAGDFSGFTVAAEPGTPAWFETMSRSYEASVAFYQKAFGWQTATMSDTPEFRYTTLGENETAKAGIMDAAAVLPDGVPSLWQVYLAVADTDAAVARVVELGGSIEQPAGETPYGRLAYVVDPTGARFAAMGPAGASA